MKSKSITCLSILSAVFVVYLYIATHSVIILDKRECEWVAFGFSRKALYPRTILDIDETTLIQQVLIWSGTINADYYKEFSPFAKVCAYIFHDFFYWLSALLALALAICIIKSHTNLGLRKKDKTKLIG